MTKPKVVVVTGASAGVGRATVRAFARDGASVGLIARGEDRLEEARADVESAGARALAIQADVADADQMNAAAARFERELGPIDVWVNNAMTSVFAPVADTTADEFARVTQVTYLGSVWGTMAALRHMRPRDRGVIVQVGSALAFRGIPLQAAYCGSKHALQGFIESLRTELMHDGSRVRVTMVQLPALNTPQFGWSRAKMPRRPQPVPPIFQPEVAASAIVWAARHPPRQMMVGWPTVKAIVGNAVAPWLADRILARDGYALQQTPEPNGDHPDNLFGPVAGRQAAHGRFDDQARNHSLQLWARTHAPLLGGLAVSTVALAARTRRQ